MANQDEIGDVLQILHALYPHSSPMPKVLSEEKLAEAVARLVPAWHTILGDLPAELLNLAVKQLASSSREFFPPAGVVTQRFGARPEVYRQWGLPGHEGIDLGARLNAPIYACAAGTVYQVYRDDGKHN